MPEMLRGYNERIVKHIQERLDQLQIGDCCYVKISYIDNGEGISPYNYEMELLETPSREPVHNLSTAAYCEGRYLPFAAPSIDHFSALATEEIASGRQGLDRSYDGPDMRSPAHGEVDLIAPIAQLHEEIQKLQADIGIIKEWLAENLEVHRSTKLGRAATTNPGKIAVSATVNPEDRGALPNLSVEPDYQQKEIILSPNEQTAIQYMIDHRRVTELQLRNECHFSSPTKVMDRLIEKMTRSHFPWISVDEDENGELIYIWAPPEENGN
jgi:hypothetical protein